MYWYRHIIYTWKIAFICKISGQKQLYRRLGTCLAHNQSSVDSCHYSWGGTVLLTLPILIPQFRDRSKTWTQSVWTKRSPTQNKSYLTQQTFWDIYLCYFYLYIYKKKTLSLVYHLKFGSRRCQLLPTHFKLSHFFCNYNIQNDYKI